MGIAIVTGAAGLIGAECVRRLAAEGLDVVGIDNDMRAYFFGREASTAWSRAQLEIERSWISPRVYRHSGCRSLKRRVCSIWHGYFRHRAYGRPALA